MSRQTKKYSSSRYSHNSERRRSNHPRAGSIRTIGRVAGAAACAAASRSVAEEEPPDGGAVTDAIRFLWRAVPPMRTGRSTKTASRANAELGILSIRVPESRGPDVQELRTDCSFSRMTWRRLTWQPPGQHRPGEPTSEWAEFGPDIARNRFAEEGSRN